MLKFKEEKRLDVMPNIKMREFNKGDAFSYYELYNQKLIAKYLPDDMIPRDVESAAAQISTLFLRGRSVPYWAIVDSQTDFLIGTCGFVNSDFYNKRLEIAYDLHPKFWGMGIMHNAINVCLKHAFEKMGIRRVEAVTLADNAKSSNVLLRCGFKFEGVLRSYKFFHNQMVDVQSFSFTLEDYQKCFKK